MTARIGGICAVCGLPGHRYGTTDTEHKPDAVGCVNQLRGVIGDITRNALDNPSGPFPDLGWEKALKDIRRIVA